MCEPWLYLLKKKKRTFNHLRLVIKWVGHTGRLAQHETQRARVISSKAFDVCCMQNHSLGRQLFFPSSSYYLTRNEFPFGFGVLFFELLLFRVEWLLFLSILYGNSRKEGSYAERAFFFFSFFCFWSFHLGQTAWLRHNGYSLPRSNRPTNWVHLWEIPST